MTNLQIIRTRSYATRANAIKAAEGKIKELGIDGKLRYIVAANEDGRYSNVATAAADSGVWHALVHSGNSVFCVVCSF